MPSVHYLGKISFTEAQYLQQKANLLLLIDNPIANPAHAMYFPSKLLDYMVAGKRVLAITTKGSATDDVMKDLKGDVVGHNEVDQIRKLLSEAVCKFSKQEDEYFLNAAIPGKYAAKINAERLAQLIKDVVKK
jgi:hypothetical protein